MNAYGCLPRANSILLRAYLGDLECLSDVNPILDPHPGKHGREPRVPVFRQFMA